jgi:hypothetical protein
LQPSASTRSPPHLTSSVFRFRPALVRPQSTALAPLTCVHCGSLQLDRHVGRTPFVCRCFDIHKQSSNLIRCNCHLHTCSFVPLRRRRRRFSRVRISCLPKQFARVSMHVLLVCTHALSTFLPLSIRLDHKHTIIGRYLIISVLTSFPSTSSLSLILSSSFLLRRHIFNFGRH